MCRGLLCSLFYSLGWTENWRTACKLLMVLFYFGFHFLAPVFKFSCYTVSYYVNTYAKFLSLILNSSWFTELSLTFNFVSLCYYIKWKQSFISIYSVQPNCWIPPMHQILSIGGRLTEKYFLPSGSIQSR